jgi:hypothetical protein
MTNDPCRHRIGGGALLLAALSMCLAGCAWHWPWKRRAAAPPPAVNEVRIAADGALTAPISQYWDRNTLLIDLSGLAGAGAATMTPISGRGGWPVRLEFRVRPGSMAQLEVVGAQRVVLEIPTAGAPVLLKLPAGAYGADTPQISLRWNAADDSPR